MSERKGKGPTGGSGPNPNNNLAQFKYSAMSNLVLKADRRFTTRRGDEATGDPESLAGRINIKDMGNRTHRDSAPVQKRAKLQGADVERGSFNEGADILQSQASTKSRGGQFRGSGILSQQDMLVEGLKYRPRTQATQETYNLISIIVAENLGDVPSAVVRSAADAVLEYLKDPDMKELDKQKEIEDILGVSLDKKKFNELVNLGKKITDYDAQDEDEEMGDGEEDDEVDDKQGIAVVFDDEEDEEAQQTFEVREAGDDSDDDQNEEEEDEESSNRRPKDDMIIDEDGGMIIGSNINGDSSKKDAKIIPVNDIDAYWLQRQIGRVYNDPHTQQQKTKEIQEILSGIGEDGDEKPLGEIENELMDAFDYEQPDLVSKLVLNRDRVIWVTKWRRAAEDPTEKAAVQREMIAAGHGNILRQLRVGEDSENVTAVGGRKMKLDLENLDVPSAMDIDTGHKSTEKNGILQPKNRQVKLRNFIFEQGNHLMTNNNVKLPQGSTKKTFKGYEEIHVPPPKPRKDPNDQPDLPTTVLPEWARIGFGKSAKLNRIQTKCFPTAFEDDGNMLICAPTGSGKTNVAMLAILREIGKHRDPETGRINLDEFKIVFIAPLKALVQEQVGNFGKRLESYGITVAELTGDRQLTKKQISETQVIVTTPEKWDVITRKATDTSYTNLVRLICIDEIHLLHDDRGPVIESIVSRTIRRSEHTGEAVRLVGLSATLPNYRDVASFLRVDPQNGLFHFDASFRPCPLKQEFIGVTDKKAIKQLKIMNDVCYTKVLEQVGQAKNQMLIFVHSRKETAKTAKYIKTKLLEENTITQILQSDAAAVEILKSEAEQVSNADLKEVMPYGFGIHHAGMSRADRNSVEELFSDGYLKVLVCTATLAWGVNLPAHTVIIKGTQIYSPEKGSWVELSPQDVLQMLGRAGRPQFDTYGEGIIITAQGEIQYYLSLLNQQLPIESQFIGKLADNLNAEIVLGNVRTRDEAVEWLGYTYLYVRMLRSPGLYSVGAEYEDDDALLQKRVDLIHAAATELESCGLIRYDEETGKMTTTELGRIASHYYISHTSMQTYSQQIQPSVSTIELFRIFSLSEEFKYIPVRQDEKLELSKLLTRVPIPVKETVEEPQAKINVLLQAYISRLKLDGLALMADMVYVTQSAGRILRAIYEISLRKGWSSVAKLTLDLCKMAEKRMWPTMTPLRQFPTCPKDIIQKVERIEVPWTSYFDLDPPRMGELIGVPRAGKLVCGLVEKFPRLEIQAQIQPITRSLLRMELTITPNFEWDDSIHGGAEGFLIIAEDCDGDEILYHDQFLLAKQYAVSESNEHVVDFTVPMTEPIPPHYFVSITSDRWMHSETKVAVSFQKLILPERFPPHTQLLDLQPLPINALKLAEYQSLYPWKFFNKIQTQTFPALYNSEDNVLVSASTGNGKTVCAEFALLNLWRREADSKALYIAPHQEQIDFQLKDWQKRLSHLAGGKEIVKLVGDSSTDLRLLDQGNVILATPQQWDIISRQWQRRKNVQNIKLIIADDLHLVGGYRGYAYETIISRMQAMAVQKETKIRIIGLSVSLSNARDLGEWIGATKHTIFNFSPKIRAIPLELHLQSFTIPHHPSLMIAMAKPVYQAILQLSPDKPSLVFVSSRKQVRATALDIFSYCVADDNEDRFLNTSVDQIEPVLEKINENALAESLRHGIGYFHEALDPVDKRIVEHLFKIGAIQVLLVSRDSAWEVESTAHLVIVMGTQFFEGREHRYIDYPISDVLQMFGKAGRIGKDKLSRGVLMLPAVKREYYKKFFEEALPMESQFQSYLHDALVSEISTGIISEIQDVLDWITYTYFYRRLMSNPSFYGLVNPSNEGLSEFLSDLVQTSLNDIVEAKLIEVDEDDDTITPLNPAVIAAYYDISFITMQTFLLSLNAKTKQKGLLEIVTSATEFEEIQIRRHEEHVLRRLYDRVPAKMSEAQYESAHFKAFVLLQAHLSRMQLPVDLSRDQEVILRKSLNLLSACVDVLSSEGYLNATIPMEMSQMIVQAMWDRESPLKQIPYFDDRVVGVANEAGIEDIYTFMDAMDPEENKDFDKLIKNLALSNDQLKEAADFTNQKYPNLELEYNVLEADEVVVGDASFVSVSIERQLDEDEELNTTVHAPFYPQEKTENWWLVIGNEKTKALCGIKRVTIGHKLQVKLEYQVATPGEQTLTLYLISDSYLGVDQVHNFKVTAAPGEDDDDDDDEDEEEDEEDEMDED